MRICLLKGGFKGAKRDGGDGLHQKPDRKSNDITTSSAGLCRILLGVLRQYSTNDLTKN